MAKIIAGLYANPQPSSKQSTFDRLTTDGSGNLNVVINGGAGSGGTSSTDEAPFTAGVSAGTPIMGEDPTSGELLIVALAPGTRNLATAVTVSPVQSNTSSAVAQSTVGVTNSLVLASNVARKRFMLQNTGTTKIYIGLGQVPTTSAYHFALPAGGSSNDGSSSIWQDTMWTGDIRAISSASGGTLVVTELT